MSLDTAALFQTIDKVLNKGLVGSVKNLAKSDTFRKSVGNQVGQMVIDEYSRRLEAAGSNYTLRAAMNMKPQLTYDSMGGEIEFTVPRTESFIIAQEKPDALGGMILPVNKKALAFNTDSARLTSYHSKKYVTEYQKRISEKYASRAISEGYNAEDQERLGQKAEARQSRRMEKKYTNFARGAFKQRKDKQGRRRAGHVVAAYVVINRAYEDLFKKSIRTIINKTKGSEGLPAKIGDVAIKIVRSSFKGAQ